MRAGKLGRFAPVVAPIRLRNSLWLFVMGGLWIASQTHGTPHLRVSYRWNGSEKSPHYYACNYWGLTTFRVEPSDGMCPLFVLARAGRKD